MRLTKIEQIVFSSCFALFCASSLPAQDFSRFTFEAGAGFTETAGNTGRYLNNGWNLQAGAGMNFTNRLGAMLETDFSSLPFNGPTLAALGNPAGEANVFSATIDPIFHLTPHKRFDVYAIGGGGYYHWQQQFAAPISGASVSPLNSGAFPIFTPSAGQQYVVNKPGWNAGMGIAFGSTFHGKFYAEARYVHIFFNNQRADYVPVTFGFRF